MVVGSSGDAVDRHVGGRRIGAMDRRGRVGGSSVGDDAHTIPLTITLTCRYGQIGLGGWTIDGRRCVAAGCGGSGCTDRQTGRQGAFPILLL